MRDPRDLRRRTFAAFLLSAPLLLQCTESRSSSLPEAVAASARPPVPQPLPRPAPRPVVPRAWADPGSTTSGVLPAHSFRLTELALTRDGSLLGSLDLDGHLRFWQTDRGAHVFTWPRSAGGAKLEMALSPSGSYVATLAGAHPRVHVLDLHRQREVAALDEPVRALAFSPDERLLALSRLGGIELYSLASSAVVGTLQDPGFVARRLLFSPDGERLIAYREHEGDHDRSLREWSLASGASSGYELPHGPTSQDRSDALVLLDEGRTLAFSNGWELWRFDLATRSLIGLVKYPHFHCEALNDDCKALSVASSKGGKWLAIASAGIVEIYDPVRNVIVHDVHLSEPQVVAWADDDTLAVGTRDGGITLYDGATRRPRVFNVRRGKDDDDR